MKINQDIIIEGTDKNLSSLVKRTLFDGWSNDTITLSDSVYNYEYIRIFFGNIDGFKSSIDIYMPVNDSHGELIAVYPIPNGMIALQTRIINIFDNNKIGTYQDRFQEIRLQLNNVNEATNTNHLYIYRVVGFKY